MKIACTYENGMIYDHFGHCPSFLVYDTETKEAVLYDTSALHGPQIVSALHEEGVSVLIGGGMGPHPLQAAEALGMEVICGASGDCEEVLGAYLKGELKNDPTAIHACCHGEGHA